MSADCWCDYDSPEFYFKEEPKARKMHSCTECGKAIQPGETYERVRGKWDGDISVFRTCSRCVALRECVKAHLPCACLSHGNLLEDVREERFHLPADAYGSGLLFEMGRLAVAIKRAPSRKELMA